MKHSKNILRYPYHVLRPWLVQPFFWTLFFLSPYLNWFRVDMTTQRIIYWGKAYPFAHQYIQWIPIGFYSVVILIAVLSVLLGRVFCGWACPHNTLTEWTRVFRAPFGKLLGELEPRWMKLVFRDKPWLRPVFQLLSPLLGVLLAFGLTFSLAAYMIPPASIVQAYQSGHPHIALVCGQALFTLIGLFLLYTGHNFCRTCCPYGMGQSISAYVGNKWRPMEIGFMPESVDECKSCTVCKQVCPVDIDPRKPENLKVGQFDGCFNCGACIDACKFIHSFKRQPGFLKFQPPLAIRKTFSGRVS